MEIRRDVRDGMLIEWDVPIRMDDGVVLRADVFRPPDGDPVPVLLAYGPYAKGLGFEQGYPEAWHQLVSKHPEVVRGSSGRYQAWEVPDPERWVPNGYACVRVDARGWGRSPGVIDPWSERETHDLFACIEWTAAQAWSTENVGLLGISYYAINQWHVAALQPPHLAAMIPWEGFTDLYREMAYHGGIGSDMKDVWYRRTITTVQHGLGERAARNQITGELVAGPETLPDEELESNRSDFPERIRAHPLDDAFYRERSAPLERITVPFLSAANWGGSSLHLRGNVEGFSRAASERRWLEIHTGEHWAEFYTEYGIGLQKRFFDHFLKGIDNGWADHPAVMLRIRTVDDGFVERTENEWPLARTSWTRRYLDLATRMLTDDLPSWPSSTSFDALNSDGVTLFTPALAQETEITGPLATKLYISSTTTDADLFVVVRVFDPDGGEVTFQGAVDPHTPLAHGWLRASHRALDPTLSTEHRPYHPHDRVELLTPGTVYELDVEIWPTGIIVPPGYQIGLTVRGKDYEWSGAEEVPEYSHFKGSRMRGVGIYTHTDPASRPPDVIGGTTTLYSGGNHRSYLMLPVIP